MKNMRLGAAMAALAVGLAGSAWAAPDAGEYSVGIISDCPSSEHLAQIGA